MQLQSLLTSLPGVGGWLVPCRGYFTHRKETKCPFQRKPSGSQGLSRQVWRTEYLLSPPGFKLQTVLSIVSCYANYAILGPCDAVQSSSYLPVFFRMAAVGLCFETSVRTCQSTQCNIFDDPIFRDTRLNITLRTLCCLATGLFRVCIAGCVYGKCPSVNKTWSKFRIMDE